MELSPRQYQLSEQKSPSPRDIDRALFHLKQGQSEALYLRMNQPSPYEPRAEAFDHQALTSREHL